MGVNWRVGVFLGWVSYVNATLLGPNYRANNSVLKEWKIHANGKITHQSIYKGVCTDPKTIYGTSYRGLNPVTLTAPLRV